MPDGKLQIEDVYILLTSIYLLNCKVLGTILVEIMLEMSNNKFTFLLKHHKDTEFHNI